MAVGVELDPNLTPADIGRLASRISSRNMEKIALVFMGFFVATIDNLKYEHSEDPEAFSRAILTNWAYGNPNDQRLNLAIILYRAANEMGLVNPVQIHEILGISMFEVLRRKEDNDTTESVPVTEEDLKNLAEKLREHTKQTMKINVAPWMENYEVNMDEIYTELSLEKREYKAEGYIPQTIVNYSEFFIDHYSTDDNECMQREKILLKADPGMGKTSLGKKIGWDWAIKRFQAFSIVFFVFLRLVKPGDVLENVIIQHMPADIANGITKQKLRGILEKYGNRCLLILDGYDEHDGFNDHVRKIVENKSLAKCNVLLSSRPHSVVDVEKYFQTIVTVKGFTENMAKKFASKILHDQEKVAAVLSFNPVGFRGNFPLYSSPILLSFICLLVREEGIDLTTKNTSYGEIYTEMVYCLYKKFIKRERIPFENEEFIRVLNTLGELAIKTLTSRDVLRFSDILKKVGRYAFDYGLLIGQEDCNRTIASAQSTRGLLVTFSHTSLEEFFGSFNFVRSLSFGENISTIVALDDESPVFMVNPLFLHFCLWLLSDNQTSFHVEGKSEIMKKLVSYITRRFGRTEIHLGNIAELYPALDLKELKTGIVLPVFETLDTPKHLILHKDVDIGMVLGGLGTSLKTLQSVSIESDNSVESILHCSKLHLGREEDLNVFFHGDSIARTLRKVLWHCATMNVHPSLFVFPDKESNRPIDMSVILRENVQKVCLIKENHTLDVLSPDDMALYCPHLTHLLLAGLKLQESLLSSLHRSIHHGLCKRLSHVSFNHCEGLKGNLQLLFHTPPLSLTNLDLRGSELSPQDLETLTEWGTPQLMMLALSQDPDSLSLAPLFDHKWKRLTNLTMYNLTQAGCGELGRVITKNKVPRLRSLRAAMRHGHDPSVNLVELNQVQQLWSIGLQMFLTSSDLFQKFRASIVKSKLNNTLRQLDLSQSPAVEGALPLLMSHNFPSLNTLLLSDCGLKSQDLCSLAQAEIQGRLPKVRHLDISHNRQLAGNLQLLFDDDCKWKLLTHLDVEQLETDEVDSNFQDLDFLTSKVGLGSFPSLQELRVSLYGDKHEKLSNRVCWKELRRLSLVCTEMNDITVFLRSAANAVEGDLFPKLETICFVKRSESLSVDLKVVQRLRQKNVSVFSVDVDSERRQKDLDIVYEDIAVGDRHDDATFGHNYRSLAVALLATGGICLGLYVCKRILNKPNGI